MWIVGAATACVVAWAVRPFVVMARRGTLDEQRLATLREETARLNAARRRPTDGVDEVDQVDQVAAAPLPHPRPSPEATSPSDAPSP